ncbi:hypothetical protein DRP77_00895 [Candidatus Poribacteria bacterium]|nr:MAG: hypothetical protein DRP77_00895 [Candidatus Poribacteria bacterium]
MILLLAVIIASLQMDIDDDTSLDFIWEPASGDPDFYKIYVSVDWGEYVFFGTTPTNSCTIPGEDGRIYRIKVQAAAEDGRVGPMSEESDPVLVALNPIGVELDWLEKGDPVWAIPPRTKLLRNYPNPANPETWIPFQLSKPAQVVITIYDLLGRVVRRIDLGYRLPGYYLSPNRAARWDGRNESGERVSSGIYFYEMAAGRFRKMRRMTVVK